MMLPVSVLPVAAILMGVSYWIQSATGGETIVSAFLGAAGGALLNNMALLFAVGVAIGMANKTDGTSALAGLVAWLTVTTLLSPATVAALQGVDVDLVDPAFSQVQNVFVGILSGLIGAYAYNKFKDTKLPDALAFFSGRRSVSIVAAGMAIILAILLFFIWPVVYGVLVAFGEWIVTLGPIGSGLYGFFNRLLIPFGLHHALNSVFWFDVAGINDLNNFLGGTGEYGVTGQFMTGFFPIMMFGLPGAALAMYVTADSKKKKMVYGILMAAAVSAFFVGVTEPLEFAFMFVAPLLYVIHALFMGISMAVSTILPVRMGFGFSGGFIDLVLNWTNPMAQNPWIILLMGLFWFVVYFLVFRWAILRFRMKTPGREDDDTFVEEGATSLGTKEQQYARTAAAFITALGGQDNISELDNCATRLRLELVDLSKTDEQALRRAGAAGTIKPGGKSFQVIYGLNAQFVKSAMEQILDGELEVPLDPEPAESAVQVAVEAPPTTRIEVRQPLEGTVVALSEVPDATFADGIMGPGLAIEPTGDTVTSPAEATVAMAFKTGHAIALKLDDGTELLIHIGLDTVDMNGDGFEVLVQKGDHVSPGTPLIRFDAEKIRAAGHPTITPVVIMNNKAAELVFI